MKQTKWIAASTLLGGMLLVTALAPLLAAPSAPPANLAPMAFGGGSYTVAGDELASAQRAAIEATIAANVRMLESNGRFPPAAPQQIPLAWPLQASPRLADYGYHGVSGFVDHNPAYPNQLQDFTCGRRTYDTSTGYNHPGTDYFLWPYTFNKMDNDEVYVVAAAPGVIVYKQDGNYDRSCSSNNNPWNAVYVRHADGSTAWYGHLKNGSVTAKGIGSTVAAGEYLGVVGSSGNSTGPHLHFELRDGQNRTVDPYAGSCNPQASWWVVQRPYYDSAVNKVTTGDAPFAWADCPLPDEPNIRDSFQPGDDVYFTTFYRDQRSSQTSEYAIYRPNGTIFQQWAYNMSADHYAASWWWWGYTLPQDAPTGTWRFAVNFAGQSYETYFNVGAPTAVTLLMPDAQTKWAAGETAVITWSDNLGGPVRLELWQGGAFHSAVASSTPSDGAHDWAIPASLAYADNYRVRAINLADETVFGDSAAFAIVDPASLRHLAILTPTQGTVWAAGQLVTITWTANFTESVQIDLITPLGVSNTLTTTPAATGSTSWTVPLTAATAPDYRLRLTDLTYPTNQAAQGVGIWNGQTDPLWLVEPNGGEYWELEQTVSLRWMAAITPPVRLELRQGAVLTTVITTTAAAAGQVQWEVPPTTTLAGDYVVRVVSVGETAVFDDSDAPFTIWNPFKTYLPLLLK